MTTLGEKTRKRSADSLRCTIITAQDPDIVHLYVKRLTRAMGRQRASSAVFDDGAMET